MKKILLCVIVLAFASIVYSQSYCWERILSQDYIWDVQISSNGFLFACKQSFRGVLRSTDQGTTWDEIPLPPYIYKIAIDQNDFIYAGADGNWQGIYKSTDYGNTWSLCYNGYVKARSMYISKEGYIYLGDAYGLFIKSTDRGINWSIDTVNYYNDILSITTTSNGQIFICTDYGLIYTSTDYGDNWIELPPTGASVWAAKTIVSDTNDYLYTSRGESGVGISTDYGQTWNIFDNFPTATSSSVVAVDSFNNIYFAYDKVYKSTDGGSNWTDIDGPSWPQSILFLDDKILLATYSGIYRYDPATPVFSGDNYIPLNVGNQYQFIESGYALGTVWYYLRYGAIPNDTLINNQRYFNFYIENSNHWLRYSESDRKLYEWFNETDLLYMDFNKAPGDTFMHLNSPATVVGGVENLFSTNYPYKGFRYSIGPGATKTELFAVEIGLFNILYSYQAPHGGNNTTDVNLIMAALYDSVDNVQHFTNHYKPEISITPITLIDSSNFKLNFIVNHEYNRPTPPGHTSMFFMESVKLESHYSKEDSVIVLPLINANGLINYSVSTTLDTLLLKAGFAFNYRIVAKDKGIIPETSYSPDSGYYKCVWNGPTEVEDNSQTMPTYFLSQNYPNPFNPSTIISYQLPVSGKVTLKVFDVLGSEVETLVNEYRSAGSYEIEFNPASSIKNPASGIYFYQLKAGEFVETKKMILLR